MCVGSSEWIICSISMHKRRPKRSRLQLYRLKRRE
nr:protein LITTLE ZIPPER 2-like [Ipomoea batatas]